MSGMDVMFLATQFAEPGVGGKGDVSHNHWDRIQIGDLIYGSQLYLVYGIPLSTRDLYIKESNMRPYS
jgi:hypothetical protein